LFVNTHKESSIMVRNNSNWGRRGFVRRPAVKSAIVELERIAQTVRENEAVRALDTLRNPPATRSNLEGINIIPIVD
jgi:hypothetical protein